MKERLENITGKICRNCYSNGGQWDFDDIQKTINCRNCKDRLF